VINIENNIFDDIVDTGINFGGAIFLNIYDNKTQKRYDYTYDFYNNTFVGCIAEKKGGAIYIFLVWK
jgi:hypothetical protein